MYGAAIRFTKPQRSTRKSVPVPCGKNLRLDNRGDFCFFWRGLPIYKGSPPVCGNGCHIPTGTTAGGKTGLSSFVQITSSLFLPPRLPSNPLIVRKGRNGNHSAPVFSHTMTCPCLLRHHLPRAG